MLKSTIVRILGFRGPGRTPEDARIPPENGTRWRPKSKDVSRYHSRLRPFLGSTFLRHTRQPPYCRESARTRGEFNLPPDSFLCAKVKAIKKAVNLSNILC